MLKTLSITNYALIDHLEVCFEPGLTIITGETGAGKSIIMGALSLILGERASTQAIRDHKAKTVVEATFDIGGFGLETAFADADIDYADECILRREISATGRSRTFVNDTPVPIATLKQIATRLVDIHSQHSNMLLATPEFQLDILDAIAHCGPLREDYGTHFAAMKATERELTQVRDRVAKARADQDYLLFQCNQLQQLNLSPGEDVHLEARQQRLANASTIKEQLWAVATALDSDDDSTLQRLKGAAAHIAVLEPLLDELAGMGDRLQAALIELKDMAATVTDLQDGLDTDPEELQRIEARLNDIYSLERKHNVQSVDKLLDVQHDLERQLADIDCGDERVQQLEAQLDQQRQEALGLAKQLTQARTQAARQFEQLLVQQAVKLGLKNVQFQVRFTAVPLNAHGADVVEFMMAFNKNQPLMPVRDTASGGEISRVMLCIKAIVARSMSLPTIIFDEVDTGVSGDTASMIGEMMGDIARSIQVIAITHLPQVAAHGNSHLKVFKTDTDHTTRTSVKTLDPEEHILEVARMLSGRQLDQAAIDNAKSLIKQK